MKSVSGHLNYTVDFLWFFFSQQTNSNLGYKILHFLVRLASLNFPLERCWYPADNTLTRVLSGFAAPIAASFSIVLALLLAKFLRFACE